MHFGFSRELLKSSLHKSKTCFRAYIVIQDAEGSLSMLSTKQQDNKSALLCYLSPEVWENVVLSVQSVLARFRRKVLKMPGMACVELEMPVIKLCKVCLCVCCLKIRAFLSLFGWNTVACFVYFAGMNLRK